MLAALLFVLAQQDKTTWQFEGPDPGWRKVTYSGQADFRVNGHFLTISSSDGADASWSVDAPVKPGSYYRLSGRVRAEGVTGAMGALLNVHQVAGSLTSAVSGDAGWTGVSVVFRTGDRTSVQINCLFGGWGQSKGRADYDDIVLERIDMKDFPGPVTIDVTKTREAISPYIYGQFIEHLGRCIYGGIWAEMLEDRKFYYPIEGKPAYQHMREGYDRLVASPWKLVGGTARLAQSEYRAQPVLELHGTISQGNLHTLGDMKYKLRITYKGVIDDAFLLNSHIRPGTFKRNLVASDWKTIELDAHPDGTTDSAELWITCPVTTQIAAVSLMPADNIDGFRRDTIALLKELNAPIYRWPGGNFVSGYEWRDGIGDRDKRPTVPNPAWTGIETNDVGLHEFMRFCELVGAEPLVVVNTGFGSPGEAADEVAYCNAPSSHGGLGMASLRAQNGHAEPFNVRWWGIGNEMYGTWQLGHIPVAQYVTKHNQTVERMRQIDPTIKCIAVGDTGAWDEAMLPATRKNMTLLSEHIYVQERSDVVEHTRLLPEAIRRKADWHRQHQPLLGIEPVKVSMDEWNYWYGPYLYGELGTRYYWKDGLGVAAGLHEFFRNTDVFEMAQYAQTVNVIGAIKTTPTSAEFETTGLVLMMYRKYFGTIPVLVSGVNPDLGLDISAALTKDRKTLTIAVVNPFDREMTISLTPLSLAAMHRAREEEGAGGWRSAAGNPLSPLEERGKRLGDGGQNEEPPHPSLPSSAAQTSAQEGRVYTIADPDPMAYNEPGKARRLDVKESAWTDTTKLIVPKFSVTISRVHLQ